MEKQEQKTDNQEYLEEIIADSASRRDDLLQTIFTATPPWLFSALVHVIMVIIMFSIGWSTTPRDAITITADLQELDTRMLEDLPEPERPNFHEPTEITHKELPSGAVVEAQDVVMDPHHIDIPILNLFDSHDDNLSMVEVLALNDRGVSGHLHGIGQSRSARGQRIGPMLYGGSLPAAKAVDEGLAWLARAQEPDGRWDCARWGGGNHDAAMTGLALLAFLGNGQSDREGKYKENVYRALTWLKRNQRGGRWPGNFYTQGICLMAVSEAYWLGKNNEWRDMVRESLQYCLANQHPTEGGWNYGGHTPTRVDNSVTAWVLLGIKAAMGAGFNVEQKDIELIQHWAATSINADGTTGYTKNIGGLGSSNGTPPMTAATTINRIFFGWSPDELEKSFDYLHARGPSLNNLYYTYYGTLTMFQAGSDYWKHWNDQLRDPLIARRVQGRGPEFDGSWDPDNCRYGTKTGGRVWTTAVSVMCLQIYYRFPLILK